MLIVIFTYNREEMLKLLVSELEGKGHDVFIIDDGSDWHDEDFIKHVNSQKIRYSRFGHGGKRLFWNKWQYALGYIKNASKQKYICFLPDDVCNVQLDKIEQFTKQGWDNMRFAVNLSNSGARYRWGKWSTGQPDFEVDGMLLQECGYVDGCFITNRTTLDLIDIDPVPESWFNRPDKSSGVGYQMSMKLREKRVKMMLPEYSYVYHGDHESVMHPDHRKDVKLISKIK